MVVLIAADQRSVNGGCHGGCRFNIEGVVGSAALVEKWCPVAFSSSDGSCTKGSRLQVTVALPLKVRAWCCHERVHDFTFDHGAAMSAAVMTNMQTMSGGRWRDVNGKEEDASLVHANDVFLWFQWLTASSMVASCKRMVDFALQVLPVVLGLFR